MKASVALLTGMLLAAAGCSGSESYWYRSDKTFEQARDDYLECKQVAREEASVAASEEYVGRTRSPTRSPGDYSAGREGSGFDDPLDSWSAWRGTYARNVFAGCMKQKGYRQVGQHRLPSKTRTKKFYLGAVAGR